MTYEYRVRWQREGTGRALKIFQTLKGATDQKERLEQLEEDKYLEELAYMRDHEGNVMADLIGPPTIECREVGEWGPVSSQSEGNDS